MCSPAVDVGSLTESELGAHLDELELSARAMEAARARCLAEIERRGVHARDGQLSAAAWVANRHGISQSEAATQTRVARAMDAMPRVAEALSSGEISAAAADALARARDAAPQAFAHVEEAMVESARSLSHRDLRAELDRWRMREVDSDDRFARRRFTAVVGPDGMVRTDGELDPENGQYVISALRAKVDAWTRQRTDDERVPAQQRADALGEICREWLDLADRPTLGGERPHVVVTMNLTSLEARAVLDDVGPITPESALRLACDAQVTRVITGARSVPLEVGRTTKVVSPALRRALAVRDGGCAFPGCERPPGWCDAHHVRHWADGGETGQSNLVLLCRPHHRVIHRGFGVAIVDGRPEFRRPDGTLLENRSPPLAAA
jgi:plasmid maintenance system antidote protein VapI